MAKDREHEQQAAHNREFLDSIDKARYADWVATVAFYTAVHRVQALFHLSRDRCKSHRERNRILRRKFPPIWKHYHPLYSLSRLARYWCMKVHPRDVHRILHRLSEFDREVDRQMAKYRRRSP
jgi:hypothetical protein